MSPRGPRIVGRVAFAAAFLWVTIARHEAAHGLAAWWRGARVTAVRLWPGYRDDVGFYFGYVAYDGDRSAWITAAPYLAAAVWFVAALVVAHRVRPGTRARFAVVALGAVSAYADVAYAYLRFWRTGTDAHTLLDLLPDVPVHAAFAAALAAGALGLRALRGRAASARD